MFRNGGGGGGRRGNRRDRDDDTEDEDLEYGYRIAPKRKRKLIVQDGDDSSSDDDSDDGNKKGRRYGGDIFGDSDDDEKQQVGQADDDDDDNFVPLGLGMKKNKKGSKRSKNTVFGGGGDNKKDDVDAWLRPTTSTTRRNAKDNSSSAPLFVKGATLEPTVDDDDEEKKVASAGQQQQQQLEQQPIDAGAAIPPPSSADDDEEEVKEKKDAGYYDLFVVADDGDSKADGGGDSKKEDNDDLDEDAAARKEEIRKEREEANARFFALLNRGKSSSSSRRTGLGLSGTSATMSRSTLKGTEQDDDVNDATNDDGGGRLSPAVMAAGLGLGLGTTRGGGGGLGLGSSVGEQQQIQPEAGLLPTQFGGGLGLGMRKRQQHQALGSSFVRSAGNMGTWEKHTKGIGGKLLAKMGYTGSGGLGKEKKGVTKPVPVKVRPANLGLGFGNFKEVTATIKQQEEKEARQKQRKEQQQQLKNKASSGGGGATSALPSVRELLDDEPWRRGANRDGSSKRKRAKRQIVPYTELLKKQQDQSYTVIDMRGPDAATMGQDDDAEGAADDSSTAAKAVPLAEELLHNVSLLLNTYENKVYSSSSFSSSTERRLASLESDVSNTKDKIANGEERTRKLEMMLKVFDEIEELSSQSSSSGGDIPVDKIKAAVRRMTSLFSPEERTALQFADVIVPSLIGAFVETEVKKWNPLTDELAKSERLVRSFLTLAASVAEGQDDYKETRLSITRSLIADYLLPRMKVSLESLQWDPTCDCDRALTLYEMFRGVVMEVDSNTRPDDRTSPADNQVFAASTADDAAPQLADMVQDALISDVVYPKLYRSISQWKPRLGDRNRLINSPDRWVLPWIPHLDRYRSLIPTIVSDCKRRTRTAVSYLNKNIAEDDSFVKSAVETLRPWRGVFKEKTLQDIVTSYVTPRLSRLLSKIAAEDSDIPMECVDLTLEMNGIGLLSDRECLSLIEGEALHGWAKATWQMLSSSPDQVASAVKVYKCWKTRLFRFSSEREDDALQLHLHTRQLLVKDQVICCYFYSVLLMIRAAADGNVSAMDDLQPPLDSSFRIVLARRTAEDKRKSAEDLLRMESRFNGERGEDHELTEARVRLSRQSRPGQVPTFREVVAEYAREREILFQPRMGSNATKDGKQVFLFGKVPVYFESDVVFALGETQWKPTTLDELVKKAS